MVSDGLLATRLGERLPPASVLGAHHAGLPDHHLDHITAGRDVTARCFTALRYDTTTLNCEEPVISIGRTISGPVSSMDR